MKIKQLTIICGGQSAEHEVSLLSAKNVLNAASKEKYAITVLYISKSGQWYHLQNAEQLSPELAQTNLAETLEPITLNFADHTHPWQSIDGKRHYPCDIVFPVMHGTRGEDGTLQGLFEMLNVAYVGAGVLGSAICMDKHTAKCLLRQAGVPTNDWQLLTKENRANYSYDQLAKQFGPVMFLKPANLGSSVGISKVRNANEFRQGLQEAFKYDHRVIVEPHVQSREIECSVLGNEKPVASIPGEIVPIHEFYSYEAKYLDPEGAKVITPADLSDKQIDEVQQLSIKAYQALACEGMARVDFFMTKDAIMINELNTLPGFTNISMYPKNWDVSGIKYAELIDRLINLGLNRHEQQQYVSRSLEQLVANQPSANE